MKEGLQFIIDSHADILVRQLDVNGGILNRLLAKEVITADHLDEIKAERTVRQRNEKLLEILKRRDDKFYKIFREEVAKEQKQLADQCLPLADEELPFPVAQNTSQSK